eukprot:CCRYP_015278-RA/>CCRYP_015278-RA protein AED:0.00 eAED:0.00 QI:24/1/1/1/1/1/2/232/263
MGASGRTHGNDITPRPSKALSITVSSVSNPKITAQSTKAMNASSLFPLLAAATAFSTAEAFVSSNVNTRHKTTLNLEDHIADMIDGELHRLRHKHEADKEWLAKQRQWSKMEPTLPPDFDFDDGLFGSDLFDDDSAALTAEGSSVQGFTTGVNREISMVQRRKDEKMANDDPMRYCADRCVTTGNCDVFEDMFDLGEFRFCYGFEWTSHDFSRFYNSAPLTFVPILEDPREVIKFCKECVLSEDEEPCDVPEKFLEDDMGLHP